MRLTLNSINDELAKRGHTVRLEKGSGYFYFQYGEAADWLDRTVQVRTVNSLTLKEWMQEFQRLKELNAQIMRTVKPSGAPQAQKAPARPRRSNAKRPD